MIIFLVEALFALVFGRALVAYLKDRDPVQRDVTMVFSAVAMLFVLDVVRRIFGEPPPPVRVVALILLFAQPYFTLRLVHRVRSVPRWLQTAAVLGAAVSVVAVLSAPKPSIPTVFAVIGIFVGVQTTAAAMLVREAGARTGSPRVRLAVAALSTALFGFALLATSAGAVNPAARDVGRSIGYICALISAVGYVIAFLSPAWIRRLLSGMAAYRVSGQLLAAPGNDPPDRTWARYAQTVHEISGADAVLVVPPGVGPRPVTIAGVTGVAGPAPADGTDETDGTGGMSASAEAGDGDVRHLLELPAMADIRTRGGQLPAFAIECAERAGARYLFAAALRSPAGRTGALVLLSRRRSLFAEDDARLLAELGGQAAIIAERGAVLAEQERLAGELARSVRALSAASQAKSDFLASMSHELRTPLNAIIGFSELMRGEESVADSRVVPLEWVEHIYASGRHLLNLINDILDLAKIEAGRLELRPERIDLVPLVAEAANTLLPLLERKRLELRTEVEAVAVRADRVRLRQVLDNLLSNAIKFTPDGGVITVRVTRVGRAAAGRGEIQLAVTDTGVGIDKVDQERVFEEFQQAGDGLMHQAGTGLGLALTKRLVESHDGRIELESMPGVGSCFTVHLPDVYTEDRRPNPVEPPSDLAGPDTGPADGVNATSDDACAPRAPGTPQLLGLLGPVEPEEGGILLIEDEPSAARLLRMYLEGAGYRVRLASSGETGLVAARRSRPDAVVLDVLLPGIDGWEVLRQLKQDPRLQDVPVLVASVVDERDIGLSLGAVDFFVKPIDRQRLLARLAEFLLSPDTAADQMHVLAVDHDPAVLAVIAEALRERHVDVVTAVTGREAVRLARNHPFDLIISELQMPDIDGISLMSALDHDPATSKIPVLVMTTGDLTDVDRSRLNTRALGILPKGEAVHEALHHWMSHLPRHNAQPTPDSRPEEPS
jgi:signal transduction histidine kinase/CheY-like chemotaxis protein